MVSRKGGLRAAFFFILPALAVFDYGNLLPLRLGLIRATVFCAGILYLWRNRHRPQAAGAYAMIVLGFVLLALGHAFSSVYPWVSFQHAVNIAVAALILFWAFVLFRKDPAGMWENTTLCVWAMAAIQLGIAAWQRLALGNLRPNGTFDNTNFLAEFLAVAALLCLSRSFRADEPVGRRVAALASAMAFLAGALSLAASRAVLLASAPAIALLVVARFGWRRGGSAVLFVAFPIIMILGVVAARRFFETDPYTYGRLLVWKSAFLTFLDHPFGVGLGGFKHIWFGKQFPVEGTFLRYGNSAVYAHNEYLEVLAGLGIAGLIVFLAVLAYPLCAAARSWASIPDDRRGAVAASACALLLSGLHAGFDFNFHEMGLVSIGAILTGGLLAMLPEREGGVRWTPRPSMVWIAMTIVAALLIVSVTTTSGWIAWRTGERHLKKGDLASAGEALLVAVRADPFRAEYRDALGLVRYRQFQASVRGGKDASDAHSVLTDAIRWEASAMERNPGDYRFPARMAQLYSDRFRSFGREEDLASAFSAAKEALGRNPYSPALLLQRSELWISAGRGKEAEEDLLRALSLEPNFCRGYSRLAEMSARRDPEKALGWAREAEACRARALKFPLKDHERWAAGLGETR